VTDLPDLGVGVMWFPDLDGLLARNEDAFDFYEVEPATMWLRRPNGRIDPSLDRLRRLANCGKPIILHDVSSPVGGTVGPDCAEIEALARAVAVAKPPWVSTHLSINRLKDSSGASVPAGFLLPPLQTPEAVRTAAEGLRRLRRHQLQRPLAFETGVSYLRPRPGELPDGAFFAAVAAEADCHILCDLHNLWCNQHNGRGPLEDVLEAMPPERICELHLAGGVTTPDGFLLDAHAGPVDPPLLDVAVEVAERLPALRAVTFEVMPDYVRAGALDEDGLLSQLHALRVVWQARGTYARTEAAHPQSRSVGSTEHRGEAAEAGELWEHRLWSALRGAAISASDAVDPGFALYRHLIGTIRAGNVITVLPLSYRHLVVTMGLTGAEHLLHEYVDAHPVADSAQEEAAAFITYLEKFGTQVPHLDEVAAFEVAALEALATGTEQAATFSCDPIPLLGALRSGRHPPPADHGRHEVTVSPMTDVAQERSTLLDMDGSADPAPSTGGNP
jgi:uncharacterized protein (UPF0276 family)